MTAESVARERVAAHEAGHACVFLACGIPVQWVEAQITHPRAGVTRFGFTMTDEDRWSAFSPLPVASKLVRRAVGKAGGLAGEHSANLFTPESLAGAGDDLGQIGGALIELGLLPADAPTVPMKFVAALMERAGRVIASGQEVLDALRIELLSSARVTPTNIAATWTELDDEEVLLLFREMSGTAFP